MNIFLSTFNLILIIIGRPFVTTLLLPVTNVEINTEGVTNSFRIFSLIISIVVIKLNFSLKKENNIYIITLILFLIVYSAKVFFYTLATEKTAAVQYANNYLYSMYAITNVIIPLISVIYSSEKIDMKSLFYCIYSLGFYTLIYTVISNNKMALDNDIDVSMVRHSGNLALDTISYGHIAITMALLSLYILLFQKTNLYIKMFFIIGFVLSMYVSFRAGSRSPIIAFIFVVYILFFSKQKHFYFGIISIILVTFFFIISDSIIYKVIEEVSPLMYERLAAAQQGDTSYRDLIYRDAWYQFVNSPLVGSDFVLTFGVGKGWYPHNIILESLITLGLLGGILILILLKKSILNSIKILKLNKKEAVICIILLQYIILYMFSFCIYTATILFCTMGYVLSLKADKC